MWTPVGWLYGKIGDFRNRLYDKGVFKSYGLGARTISVGNITAGGTGKTPIVAYAADILAESGERVCILTRGYGRNSERERVLVSDGERVLVDARVGGDEPVELARKLLGKAVVIADADRVSAGKWAKDKFGVTAFVLDDGFQHRRLWRDLDIVCIDATNPFGNGKMLPAGFLREPLHNLKRADAVVITRANLIDDISGLRSTIANFIPKARIFAGETADLRVTLLADFHANPERTTQDTDEANGWNAIMNMLQPTRDEIRVLAFCALGNPDSFFRPLLDRFDNDPAKKFDLSVIKDFPDHHYYSQKDVAMLEKSAADAEVDILLTTVKDAVKLSGLRFAIPCYLVEADFTIDDEEGFKEIIRGSKPIAQ